MDKGSNEPQQPNPFIQPMNEIAGSDQKLTLEDNPNPDQTYKMTVDLNVLKHLGINLYSNIAAVLTEVVANAWDADAESVTIVIKGDGSEISIVDDGVGMTIEDINKKYLRVGYRRRVEDKETGKFTEKERPVMGRKGLGKLSLFSIAKIIEVQSAKDGQRHGFRMSTDQIHAAIKRGNPNYSPQPLTGDEVNITKGTKIVLKDIKRKRLGRGIAALRKMLARRFSIIGDAHEFSITINGEPITPADRIDLVMVQFLWNLGEPIESLESTSQLVEQETLIDRLETWENKDWRVSGWIGTAKKPKHLDNSDIGNLNSIVVFSRGRLFHENILDKINDGRFYTKYLTGQIEADFLDEDDEPDIATSDRQRIQEDDPRYEALLEFLRDSLRKVNIQWDEWRRKHELQEVKDTYPVLKKWFGTLPSGYRKHAESLIASLCALPADDEDGRKILYKHGILAFERMRLRGSTDELVTNISDVGKLLEILADRDALESSLYRDIVKSRLEVIENFQGLTDDKVKERVLQEYLFDHLWLLDPAWERATEPSPRMETRLLDEGIIVENMSKKEELKRVDIAYRTYAGKHIIVELKKVERKMKLLELVEQGQGYVDKLKKIELAKGNHTPDIEVVFVIGKPLNEEDSNPQRLKDSLRSVSPGSRIVHYDFLIENAQMAYSEYMDKTSEIDKIDKLVNQL